MLYTADVQFTESAEQASTPPSGLTELPTCPVCLGKCNIISFLGVHVLTSLSKSRAGNVKENTVDNKKS